LDRTAIFDSAKGSCISYSGDITALRRCFVLGSQSKTKTKFMRKLFLYSVLIVVLLGHSGCVKSVGMDGLVRSGCKLPHNAAPAELQGGWGHNVSSYNQLSNAYFGDIAACPWPSAMYFSFTDDGTGVEFYQMTNSQAAQSALKAIGTIEFDEGATAQSGSFTFHACCAHVKSWGTSVVDRNATDEEVQNVSGTYYYKMQGEWLRIQSGGPMNDQTSSFQEIE
jgi:hypothetical protein